MFKFYIVVLWIKIKKLFKLCLLLNKYLKYLNILFIIWINPMDAKNYLDLLISSLITDEPKAITDEPKAITDEPKAITDEPNEKYEKYRAISEAILVVSLMIIVIWAAYNIYNITGGGQNWGVGWGGAGVAGNAGVAANAGVDIDINIDTDSVGSDIDPGSLLSRDYQGVGSDTDNNS